MRDHSRTTFTSWSPLSSLSSSLSSSSPRSPSSSLSLLPFCVMTILLLSIVLVGRRCISLFTPAPFLSSVSLAHFLTLSLSLPHPRPVFLLSLSARLLSRGVFARSLSVYSARRVREIPGCASSKLKRSCTLGIRGLACTYIIRRKLRRAM